jgi:hypothetical protein
MARVVELADFRPSPRHDGQVWTQVRVEQALDPSAAWGEVKVLDLEPLDTDASKPALRSVSAAAGKPWLRLVFLHEEEEDVPQPHVSAAPPFFLPTISDVSTILRARTYSGSQPDPDNPMDVLAGGVLQGDFGSDTVPTDEDVEERIIPNSARDVLLALGRVPGELTEEARRVAALRAATEIERSYIPEQADETRTLYQTLRLTYQEEANKLASTIQWWVLANAPASCRRPVWPGWGYWI